MHVPNDSTLSVAFRCPIEEIIKPSPRLEYKSRTLCLLVTTVDMCQFSKSWSAACGVLHVPQLEVLASLER